MLQKIKNIFNDVTWWARDGAYPTSAITDLEKKELGKVCHFKSKKFTAVFFCLLFLVLFYFSSVAILFFIPHMPELVAAIVTLFSKTVEVIAWVVSFWLSGQSVIDLKYNSGSFAGLTGSVQDINEAISEEDRALGRKKTIYMEDDEDGPGGDPENLIDVNPNPNV